MSLYADLYEIADRVINPPELYNKDVAKFVFAPQERVAALAESLYAICQAYEDTIEEEW